MIEGNINELDHLSRMLNKVHQGDCLDVVKAIPSKSIDMVLCDLPYGTTQCSWDSIIPFKLLSCLNVFAVTIPLNSLFSFIIFIFIILI